MVEKDDINQSATQKTGSLQELLDRCSELYRLQDWDALEQMAQATIQTAVHSRSSSKPVLDAAKYFVAALISSDETYISTMVSERFLQRVERLRHYVDSQQGNQYSSLCAELVEQAHKLALQVTDESIEARGEIPSTLRKLMRPDLAITVAASVLDVIPQHLIAMTSMGAAYADLEQYDDAITVLKQAISLPTEPESARARPLNALSRAFRERFETASGDMDDLDSAIDAAIEAFKLLPNKYSANTLLAAIQVSGDEEEISRMQEAFAGFAPESRGVTRLIANRALEVLELRVQQRSTPDLADLSNDPS